MFVLYTERLLPSGAGGRAIWFLILIRPKYRDDSGLHAHERMHAAQWTSLLIAFFAAALVLYAAGLPDAALITVALAPGAHAVGYWLLRDYRLWAEVEAYREQMKCPDRTGAKLSLELAAYRLSRPVYRLGLSPEQAMQYLKT